jgi:hypothetical protein
MSRVSRAGIGRNDWTPEEDRALEKLPLLSPDSVRLALPGRSLQSAINRWQRLRRAGLVEGAKPIFNRKDKDKDKDEVRGHLDIMPQQIAEWPDLPADAFKNYKVPPAARISAVTTDRDYGGRSSLE